MGKTFRRNSDYTPKSHRNKVSTRFRFHDEFSYDVKKQNNRQRKLEKIYDEFSEEDYQR
jgi:hypothetical protein